MTDLYPLLLDPSLHVKVWGGRKLQTVLHKQLPTDEPYGESWDMHDSAVIVNGAFAGQSIGDLLKTHGADILGAGGDPAEGMPLLVKFLDANDWLSVQVHPNDEQAKALEGDPRGKTEAWYIISVEPNSQLVIGVQPGTTREQMAEAIRNGTLESLLEYATVQPGDVLLNNAGGIHALGPGIVIYEIQQSSDVTYRLYDWNRVDLNGTPRQLHIEKGVAVSNIDALPEIQHTADPNASHIEAVRSPYFVTDLYQLSTSGLPSVQLNTKGRHFDILTCIEGDALVSSAQGQVSFTAGQTVLIPAVLGAYTLAGNTIARILVSYQPL